MIPRIELTEEQKKTIVKYAISPVGCQVNEYPCHSCCLRAPLTDCPLGMAMTHLTQEERRVNALLPDVNSQSRYYAKLYVLYNKEDFAPEDVMELLL